MESHSFWQNLWVIRPGEAPWAWWNVFADDPEWIVWQSVCVVVKMGKHFCFCCEAVSSNDEDVLLEWMDEIRVTFAVVCSQTRLHSVKHKKKLLSCSSVSLPSFQNCPLFLSIVLFRAMSVVVSSWSLLPRSPCLPTALHCRELPATLTSDPSPNSLHCPPGTSPPPVLPRREPQAHAFALIHTKNLFCHWSLWWICFQSWQNCWCDACLLIVGVFSRFQCVPSFLVSKSLQE